LQLANVRGLFLRFAALGLLVLSYFPALSFADNLTISNHQLSVAVRNEDGAYEIHLPKHLVLRSIIGAEINHRWVRSSEYPKHKISRASFQDMLGPGQQLTVIFSGLAGQPNLSYTLRLYDDLPFGDIEVQVFNNLSRGAAVEHIRCVEAVGDPALDLAGPDSSNRVLSDSYSESRLHIYDLEQAPQGLHFAVGSQLIYNRQSKQSLFLGALSADKFLSIFHLRADTGGSARMDSYTVDSGGTTEVRFTAPWSRSLPPSERIELSLPLSPGQSLSSERLMFEVGDDYHAQLEQYGAAIRELHHARVNSDNLMGWWSWTSYYSGINEGSVYTNAQWLAQHLKDSGYRFFHLDEGFSYSRGEYLTPDASKFPNGMRDLSSEISRLGLNLGLWVAPLQVGKRAWVAQNHKDWLVRNARGQPLWSHGPRDEEPLYVLDATNPHAREYLRQTFQTLTREWGARYIKLDFMDLTAVEGYYYRPHTTALEALRFALQTIREAVGERVLLDKDGSPMLTPVGIVDEGRISGDTKHSFRTWKDRALGLTARYYMHRNFFVSDPDAFTLQKEIPPRQIQDENSPRAPLTLSEAQMTIVATALTGGMFEIGDDLPTLASEPERVALVTNPDLLQIVKLGLAAKPLDLLEYEPEDLQPSISFLREDNRQWILAVFNWTEQLRSHTLGLTQLGLANDHKYDLYDIFDPDQPLKLEGNTIAVIDQPPHSVKMIKIVDRSVSAASPTLMTETPEGAKAGETLVFAAKTDSNGVPAIDYRWDFGDGVSAEGARLSHTYTLPGNYKVTLRVNGIDGVPAEKEFVLIVQGNMIFGPPARYLETLSTEREIKHSQP
jgi:alpha-galactosidase